VLALVIVLETVLAVGIVISVGHSRFQRWTYTVENSRLCYFRLSAIPMQFQVASQASSKGSDVPYLQTSVTQKTAIA
jgi:hypothetical protein